MTTVQQQMTDMRTEYGKTLIEIGRENPNVVVLGADTTDSLKTAGFGHLGHEISLITEFNNGPQVSESDDGPNSDDCRRASSEPVSPGRSTASINFWAFLTARRASFARRFSCLSSSRCRFAWACGLLLAIVLGLASAPAPTALPAIAATVAAAPAIITWSFRLGLIHLDLPPVDAGAIQFLNSFLGLTVPRHFNETKAFALAGISICDYID